MGAWKGGKTAKDWLTDCLPAIVLHVCPFLIPVRLRRHLCSMDGPEYLQVINTDQNSNRYLLSATISLIPAIKIEKTPKVPPQFSRITFPFAETQKDMLSAPLQFKIQPWLFHSLMEIPSQTIGF